MRSQEYNINLSASSSIARFPLIKLNLWIQQVDCFIRIDKFEASLTGYDSYRTNLRRRHQRLKGYIQFEVDVNLTMWQGNDLSIKNTLKWWFCVLNYGYIMEQSRPFSARTAINGFAWSSSVASLSMNLVPTRRFSISPRRWAIIMWSSLFKPELKF